LEWVFFGVFLKMPAWSLYSGFQPNQGLNECGSRIFISPGTHYPGDFCLFEVGEFLEQACARMVLQDFGGILIGPAISVEGVEQAKQCQAGCYHSSHDAT
jgi:hypothetical protein